MSKIAKLSIVLIISLLVAGSIVGAIFALTSKPTPPSDLVTEKLATPKNIILDQENWILSYSKVDNAVGYEVFVNDKSFKTSDTSVTIPEKYIAGYGLYQFQVRAIYSISYYDSDKSASVYGEKYNQLATPENLSWSDNRVLYWSQVEEALSYKVLVKYQNDDGEQSVIFKTSDIKYDLNTLLNYTLSNISFFTIQVKATSEDNEGNSNKYLTESEYSEAKVYYKVNAIEAPVIALNNLSTEQASDKILTWDKDFAVQKYVLYIDGENVGEYTSNDNSLENQISVNLTDIISSKNVHIGDTLGLHNVYITAVPKTDENYESSIHPQNSNRIEYTVTHKLKPVDSNTIELSKFGSYLRIEWEHKIDTGIYGTNYEAFNYIVKVFANANPENENSTYSELIYENNSPDICTLNIPLSDLESWGKVFKVQIKSIWQGYEYVYDSDYSDFSAEYSAVTKLDTPTNVTLTELNGNYTLSWRANSTITENQTYQVNVYKAEIRNNEPFVEEYTAVVSQTTTEKSVEISTLMNANINLESGYYAVTVRACGVSMYYVDSDESELKGFTYKIRLKTPEIDTITNSVNDENKKLTTLKWTYIENATEYYITINDKTVVKVSQPDSKPDGGLISETDSITQELTNVQQYKFIVQAIASSDGNYLNSLQSPAKYFINKGKHQAPKEITVKQEDGKNAVKLEWTAVSTVTDEKLSSRYQLYIGTSTDGLREITLDNSKSNIVEDISNFLKPGVNYIRVRCSDGTYYEASNYTEIEYTYNYTPSGSANVTYSLVNSGEGQAIEVTIHSSENDKFEYLTDYFVEFSTGKTKSVLTQSGADAVFTVGFDYLPLYESTTLTIYAGKKDNDTLQTNIYSACSWTSEFTNNLYVQAPTITYDADTYIATISIAENAINFTKQIEWRLTGTAGVNIRGCLNDFTTNKGTFNLNLKDLGYINDGDEMLVGDYHIYALTVSNQTGNARSNEVCEDFRISKTLPNPTNFVQADDNSYLQWDKIENASGYEILVNGDSITPTLSETTVTNEGIIKKVIRLSTADLLATQGTYAFKIKAIGDETYYKSNADFTTYEWIFNNQLNTPTVNLVTYDNKQQLAIFYNNLVEYYSIKCDEANLDATASDVTNGYVYYDIESAFDEINAGKYTILVSANPKDSKYMSSNSASVEFVWQKRFDTPKITVTQDFDNDKMIIEWQEISASILSGTEKPKNYQISISTTDGTVLLDKESLDSNSYEVAGSSLEGNVNYIVDVCAIANENGVMKDSLTSSVRFTYQPRLKQPTISASSQTLIDNEQITISASDLDENAYQLNLRIELLDESGEVAETKTFNNIKWNSGAFTIEGKFHLTARGIYRISVENVQNKQYVTSKWSNYIYIYYGQTFAVATNISASIDAENNVTVSFDKAETPTLSNITKYTLTAKYQNGENTATQTVEIGTTESKFTFAGDENWKNAFDTQNTQFTFEISAVTEESDCKPNNLGLAKFNFAPTSTTTYSFVIGVMSDPTDIKFTVDGTNGKISWIGDTRFTGVSYEYSLYMYDEGGTETAQENQTTTQNSITFALDKPYAIKFVIQSKFETMTSNIVTKYFANTQELSQITDFAINYDGTYKASWTNILPNSTAFTGASYTLTLNGAEFEISSFEIENNNAVLTLNDVMINAIHSNGRNVNWVIAISDCTYAFDNEKVVIYNGNISSGSIDDAPVVITEAPKLELNGTIASWSAIPFATQYEIRISNTDKGTAIENRSSITTNTSFDITPLLNGLTAGDYYVVVKVAQDEANKVYVSGEDADICASVQFKHTTPAEAVEGLSASTLVSEGKFVTTVIWYYSIENTTFNVYLTDSNGTVTTIAEKLGVNDKFKKEISSEKYKYTFSFFDGTEDDPTRNLPAGEYVLSVVVCGYDDYHTNSPKANTSYTNKFNLTKIENAENFFTVVPDCYATGSDDLASYKSESQYGFNTKFFVMKDTISSKATHFKVYVFDTTSNTYVFAGKLENKVTGTSFDSISTTNNKILLSNIVAGKNKIKIIPYGDENYYYYVKGNSIYTLSEKEDELASEFTVNLSLMEEKPNLNDLSIDVTYSDSPTNTNITEIALVFRNAKVGSTYRITPYYASSYDTSLVDVECESFDVTLTESDFSNGIFLGIKVFDKIRHYGPHTYYFTVQTLSRGAYYKDSDIARTTKEVALKTRLVEFLAYDKNVDSAQFSLVTEITNKNETETLKNGMLTWTLPVHAYSIAVKYTVRLQDKNQSTTIMQDSIHNKDYSAYLIITVDKNNNISYAIEQSADYFFIDNGVIAFDMRSFFDDTSRIKDKSGNTTGAYYLAGTYDYSITAEALGTNKEVVNDFIFSPQDSYEAEYTYRDIPYPNTPTDVKLSSAGELTWEFSDNIYGYDTAGHFGIVIRNYSEGITPSTKQSYTEKVIVVNNENNYNIAEYLVAGGKARNEVFIYTIAPNDYYLNSEYVTVGCDNLSSTSNLPEVFVTWDNQREVTIETTEMNNKVAEDLKEEDIYFEISLIKLTNNTDFEKDLDYDTIKNNNILYSEISWSKANGNEISYTRNQEITYNLLNEIKYLADNDKADASIWISNGDSLASGYYYMRVTLKTSSIYYADSVCDIKREILPVWRSATSNATIEGEHLTTKLSTEEPNPQNRNDHEWGEASQKDAYLTFYVNTTQKKNDKNEIVYYIPKTITVTAKLVKKVGYGEPIELTYEMPVFSEFVGNVYESEDIRVERFNSNVQAIITINLHQLFDKNTEAGVYQISWVLNGDEVGDVSDEYVLKQQVCHYVVLPTPILDYRLDYTTSGNAVINWVLTPNKDTLTINETCEYKVNIFAFEETNGTFDCDTDYAKLTDKEKAEFLYSSNQSYFITNATKQIKDSDYANDANDYNIERKCYIIRSNGSLNLTPNKNYKIFMYLSPTGAIDTDKDPNSVYYLNSDTSVGVTYMYKAISGVHRGSQITPKDGEDLVENEDIAEKVYYTITSTAPDSYNNTFEFWIYDTTTQDAVTYDWMKTQESNNTCLAHWIVGTKGNSSSGPLYILKDYSDGTPNTGTLDETRDIGYLSQTTISINSFVLNELLGDKVLVPTTYYCKIKSWIDNNTVNSNAPLEDGRYTGVEIYSREWIIEHIPYVKDKDGEINDDLVTKLYEKLQDKTISVNYLDINKLNGCTYFTFTHKIKYATPTINSIEIYNTDNSGNYVDSNGDPITDGSTGGYLIADSDYRYYYKIWLDNVYTTDPNIIATKEISLQWGIEGKNTWSDAVNFTIEYTTDDKAYIILSNTTAESMFTNIDASLPNNLVFRVQAVCGTNSDNFGTYLSSKGNEVNIYLNYIDSGVSENYYLTIKKQYKSPTIKLMFDTMGNELTTNTKNLVVNGYPYTTNLVENGDYVGLASNPYITINSEGMTSSELASLQNSNNTEYKITISYKCKNGKSTCFNSLTIGTQDLINTESGFKNAISSNSARFNYNSYKDIYPYEKTCLYEIIYGLINAADESTSSNYHGGFVTISIKTCASESSSLWVDSAKSETSLYFYCRLETVKATFDQNACEFRDCDDTRVPSAYASGGAYYYYQSYIPYNYTSISRKASYQISLTRKDNASYNADNYKVKDKLTLSPNNTNTSNTKNLADILGVDLGSGISYYNQWRLPSNENDSWHINIIAVADDSMEYVGRGFDSNDCSYFVHLKIKNDIDNDTSFDMKKLVNRDNTVTQVTADKIRDEVISLRKSSYATKNLAINSAKVYYYYPFTGEETAEQTYENITSYYKLFSDIIESLQNNSEIRGSDGFKIYIKLFNSGTNQSDYIEEGDYTEGLSLTYYRQLPFDTSKISLEQSGDSIVLSADYPVSNQIESLELMLEQRGLDSKWKYSVTYSSCNTRKGIASYYASKSFDPNNADCFDSESRTISVYNMKNNHYTAFPGYIQGGKNLFTITPVKDDSYKPDYNLLPTTALITKDVTFTVNSNPSCTINITTSTVGDKDKPIKDKWDWDNQSTTSAVLRRYMTYGEYYGKIDRITTNFYNIGGASITANWTYRFDKNSQTSKTPISYSNKTGSTTDIASIPTTPAQTANYFKLAVTIKCKSGFESVFKDTKGKWTFSKEATADAFVGERSDNTQTANIADYLTVKITGGQRNSGDTGEYARNLGRGANINWYLKGEVSLNSKKISNAGLDASIFNNIKINVKILYRPVFKYYHTERKTYGLLVPDDWDDLVTPHTDTRTMNSGYKILEGINCNTTNSFDVSGSYFETIHDAWWAEFKDVSESSASIWSCTRAS